MLQVIIKVDWFRAEYKGSRATMRREPSGFWSVDSTKLLRASKEPYILPTHVQQAFFYKNPNASESSWWQIVHINPRGRRIFDSSIEIVDNFHVKADYSDVSRQNMVPLNESEVNGNDEIEDVEDDDQDLVDTESVDLEDNLQLDELQLTIPLDVTEEEQQELKDDIENSNMYIE